jgi:hypothetical protein
MYLEIERTVIRKGVKDGFREASGSLVEPLEGYVYPA